VDEKRDLDAIQGVGEEHREPYVCTEMSTAADNAVARQRSLFRELKGHLYD
jgi:hypothetical protein